MRPPVPTCMLSYFTKVDFKAADIAFLNPYEVAEKPCLRLRVSVMKRICILRAKELTQSTEGVLFLEINQVDAPYRYTMVKN